eukprot:Gregarina_sp_Pseudo_9__1142@NODE_174_length_3830_cov_5_452915_g160_i0_p1_GENE_NODE_174_length_3830_cov_5_452915_g160_i0NODE_174_length_3830_cov_5_452915_g160_i0_p1_ORF_typecomplete_len1164_score275_23Dynamin_N/PF00350_23/5_2e17Dynamin_N/PF00350_23/3_1e03MMR_HSR1/PF01926_23/4_5e05FeoB_N/PF02421_18/1_2e02FeoB_N/PF02421_18/0_29AIG1/PF04548_16/0_77AIG1/PF04548_16/3_1e03DUF749/PF05370_11/0_23V_ATPase_I_N/PF18670_1/3_8e03V_ATPase_I_N/PF18670_1/0_44TniB/PF05621_11/0_28Gag_spuma/PF03276_14/9_8_NODE_174_
MGDAESESSRVDQLNDFPAKNLPLAREFALKIDEIEDSNAMYQRCFQVLKLGSLEAEMPRLVVFGQQSMGKTTLLDMIMGGPIGYSSTDTGTKQPVVIMLKPNNNPAVAGLSTDEGIECMLGGKPVPIKDLQKAMHQIMASAKTISSEELPLEISIPGGVHAVFVDLPGIKDDSAEGATLTRQVVRHYVQNNPNDLYILVKKASDDPANWPYSLREFILSPRPLGLGLTPKQTVVVGTRAKDFLKGEMNDVRTLFELKKRVEKRAVTDGGGRPLPLFLLELFSLSISEKDDSDFARRKARMDAQILSGREDNFAILRNNFEATTTNDLLDLEKYFDTHHFSKELNNKFQGLLSDQLNILEKRLVRKRGEVIRCIKNKERELLEQGSATIRESVNAFVVELSRVVTELITGNFEVLRLKDSNTWLMEHAGALADNLKEGHILAVEMYGNDEYPETFLTDMHAVADRALKKMSQRRTNDRKRQELKQRESQRKEKPVEQREDAEVEDSAENEEGEATQSQGKQAESPMNYRRNLTHSLPCPDRVGGLLPGQYARFAIRNGSQMLGFVKSLTTTSANVSFAYRTGENSAELEQPRAVNDLTKLEVVLPLASVITPAMELPPFLAWRQSFRADNWRGAEPVLVKSVGSLNAIAGPWLADASDCMVGQSTVYTGSAQVCPLINVNLPLVVRAMREPAIDPVAQSPMQQIQVDENKVETVSVMDLFVDAEVVNQEESIWNSMTALQRIAGEFAETKLLNQLSLTYLGRWLKFHISNLEAECRVSDDVLLQMMRSVRHVVDKADWEPLVADLLQMNVKSGILQLARLAACSTSVALRRILKAGLSEIKRRADASELTNTFIFLLKSQRFLTECEEALETYCRDRAAVCEKEMQRLILDQTHAIHFEMIADIFKGCRQFEAEFLGSETLCGISEHITSKLEARKSELGRADVYSHGAQALQCKPMIYEEVRVHFWVVKMLLSAPMTTKLYIAFVKDIKDKSQHLAAERRPVSCRSPLETALLDTFLNEANPDGTESQRTEEMLTTYYNFTMNQKEIQSQLEGYKRAAEYIQLTLSCVGRLRALIAGGHDVDFLKRLGSLGSKPASSTESIPPSSTGTRSSSSRARHPTHPTHPTHPQPAPRRPSPSATASTMPPQFPIGWDTATTAATASF